ncbi:MAG: PAS domain S-box protein [Pseudomonadota bacterium]
MSEDTTQVQIFPAPGESRASRAGRRSGDLSHLLSEAVISTALDAIVVVDEQGSFVAFNDAAEALFGHKAKDVIGKPMAELIIPKDMRGAHHGGMDRYLKTGEKRVIGNRVEVPALHASGETIWVELTVAPVPFEEQHYFTAYIRDITQRREQEEALKASEARYSELFHNSVDAIIIHDLDGRIHDVNAQAIKLLGHSREVLLATPLPALHPERDHPKAKAAFKEVTETGQTRLEINFLHSSGRVIPTEINAQRFETAEGTLVQGIVRDQTEQAQAKAERERYQRLLSSAESIAGLGSWSWDIKTGEILWSKTTYDIFGMDPDATVSLDSYTARIHPDDLDALQAKVQRAVETGEGYEIEHRIKRPDGEDVIVKALAVTETSRNKADGVRRLLGTIQDVTEARRAQDALEAARDAAEAANRAKTAFLANMSHEMRTPLNGVIGSLSLIDADSLVGEDRTHVRTAQRSADSAVTLVNDLLDISRIEAGEMVIEFATFQTEDLLEQTRELFGPTARDKGLKLTFTGQSLPETLCGDAGRIRQVLFNLVGNAVKFTEAGSVDVVFQAITSGPDVELLVQVSDTGPGVPEDLRATLFERFQQADVSKSRLHGGVGLGLAISRELVLLMGGDINLENRPEGGAKSWFRLPLTLGEAGADHTKSDTDEDTILRGHVLLAEDSATNAAVARAMLERMGLTCDHAHNGDEAVKMALAGGYDVILMDMAMPTKDGLEATHDLRAAGYTVPIIALTAHALPQSRDEALEAGVASYMTKPLNMGLLKKALAPWLGGSTAPLINEADKAERWADMDEVYAEIVSVFLVELSERVAAIENGDLKNVELNAHAIKGAAENLAAKPLFQAARNVEQAALGGVIKSHDIKVLKRIAEQTAEALRTAISAD